MVTVMRFGLWAAVLIASVSPASAAWQYTTWGMTPDQVIRAAHAGMNEVDPSTRSSVDGDKILLETPYAAGTFNFTAGFAFDSTNHLDRVRLVLQSGDAAELHVALAKRYGEPKHEDSDFDAFGGRITWITAAETIVLSQRDGNSQGVTPSVTIDYARLNNASGEGL
jgi:hypothetical protein